MIKTPGEPDLRGTADLVGHTVLSSIEEMASSGLWPTNIIVAAKTDQGRWVEAATRLIGPTRARFRSTYFHWALAINGLHVAAAMYKEGQAKEKFLITGLRLEGGRAQPVVLAEWKAGQTADNHLATTQKMYAWGYIELYAALEQFVFQLYRSFLEHHPDSLLTQKDDRARDLKRLRRAAMGDASKIEEWKKALTKRLDEWQRKKLYEGLHNVFLGYCNVTSLKKPKGYTLTSPETWAETIQGLALIRHLLVHGETTVPDSLANFCTKPHSYNLGFKTGEPLRLSLTHLQILELFLDQLLDALNHSLIEHQDAGA